MKLPVTLRATTGIVNGYEKFISYDLNKIIELPKKTLN